MKDPCIREVLKKYDLKHFIEDTDSKIVEELNLPIARARIDIAVINGALHGFEIKSASDTLKRLPSQIEAYAKVFDFISIVTEAKYLAKVTEIVPNYWGLIICEEKDGETTSTEVRKPTLNTNKEGFYLAKLLWREELLEVLKDNAIKHRKADRNWLLCEALSDNTDIEVLSLIVRQKLKDRRDWRN